MRLIDGFYTLGLFVMAIGTATIITILYLSTPIWWLFPVGAIYGICFHSWIRLKIETRAEAKT